MNNLAVLLSVASLWSVAAVTPGPNSIFVMRVSVLRRRTEALRAVAGIGLGTCAWGLSGFFGVHALFLAAPVLYSAFRICGGAYLIYFGLRLLQSSTKSEEVGAASPLRSRWGPFRQGLATSLSNPSTALSIASLFAATMPRHAPIPLGLSAIALMVAISLTWYTVLALLFAAGRAFAARDCFRRIVDRVAGAIFVVFGARLILGR